MLPHHKKREQDRKYPQGRESRFPEIVWPMSRHYRNAYWKGGTLPIDR